MSEGDEEGSFEADEVDETGEAGEEASPEEDTGRGTSVDVR